MKSRILAALFACALALAAAPSAAQPAAPDTTVREFRLADGSRVYGRVVASDAARVTVETLGGVRMELARAQVRSEAPVRGRVVNGELWLEDPHATRLFFGPTARAVPRGEGYFGVYELFFPFVTYGVTDRFTLSGGTPVIPEAIGQVFYLAPKLEVVRTPTVSVALGALAFFVTEEVDEGSAGLVYAVGTFGGPDASVSAGATVPFIMSDADSEIVREPGFMLGGEYRLSRRTKLLSENYFVPAGEVGLISAGVRFFGERLSADFGLGAGLGGGESVCCLPLVNFVYSFGGER
jgi:hypothetical protein